MELKLERIEDKVEFYQANDLKTLQRKVEEQIENNKALLLQVHSVGHQVTFDPHTGRPLYTAVVHFKAR